jgi:hypothetical protein
MFLVDPAMNFLVHPQCSETVYAETETTAALF